MQLCCTRNFKRFWPILGSKFPSMRSKFRGRGPGPMSSVRGNPVTTCVYYGPKGRFSGVTPFSCQLVLCQPEKVSYCNAVVVLPTSYVDLNSSFQSGPGIPIPQFCYPGGNESIAWPSCPSGKSILLHKGEAPQ